MSDCDKCGGWYAQEPPCYCEIERPNLDLEIDEPRTVLLVLSGIIVLAVLVIFLWR